MIGNELILSIKVIVNLIPALMSNKSNESSSILEKSKPELRYIKNFGYSKINIAAVKNRINK